MHAEEADIDILITGYQWRLASYSYLGEELPS